MGHLLQYAACPGGDEEAGVVAELLLHLRSASSPRAQPHAAGKVPYLPSSDDFDDDATNNREDDQPDCYLDSAHHIALASRLHSQSHRLQRQYDKEWAALTTWLRLNLHQPRTPKRMILFIGRQDDAAGVWSFDLNPGLTWDDVSNETKLRLKTLPDEVAATYHRRYPQRPAGDWMQRTQKYRAPGRSAIAEIPLGELVYTLQDIFFRYEGSAHEHLPLTDQLHKARAQQQQQDGVQMHAAEGLKDLPSSKRQRVEHGAHNLCAHQHEEVGESQQVPWAAQAVEQPRTPQLHQQQPLPLHHEEQRPQNPAGLAGPVAGQPPAVGAGHMPALCWPCFHTASTSGMPAAAVADIAVAGLPIPPMQLPHHCPHFPPPLPADFFPAMVIGSPVCGDKAHLVAWGVPVVAMQYQAGY